MKVIDKWYDEYTKSGQYTFRVTQGTYHEIIDVEVTEEDIRDLAEQKVIAKMTLKDAGLEQ